MHFFYIHILNFQIIDSKISTTNSCDLVFVFQSISNITILINKDDLARNAKIIQYTQNGKM